MNKYENLKSVEKHKQKIDNNGWDYFQREPTTVVWSLNLFSPFVVYCLLP